MYLIYKDYESDLGCSGHIGHERAYMLGACRIRVRGERWVQNILRGSNGTIRTFRGSVVLAT